MMIFNFWISRIRNIFILFPKRVKRLFVCLASLISVFIDLDWRRLLAWPFDVIFLLLDIIGTPEIYELVSNSFKRSLRPISQKEIRIAQTVFGDAIDYYLVWLDERAVLGPKQGNFAYVGFNTINSYGQMSNHILIHELMHIWQFQHLGSVYIWRALWAQHSREKYNYGGLQRLKEQVKEKASILSFNYEQQGDIIADYYLLVNGHRPQWSNASYADFYLYEYFVNEVRRGHSIGYT